MEQPVLRINPRPDKFPVGVFPDKEPIDGLLVRYGVVAGDNGCTFIILCRPYCDRIEHVWTNPESDERLHTIGRKLRELKPLNADISIPRTVADNEKFIRAALTQAGKENALLVREHEIQLA